MTLALLLLIPLVALLATLLASRRPRLQALVVLAMALATLGTGLSLLTLSGTPSHAVGAWSPPFGIGLRVDMLSRLMLVLTGIVFTLAATYHLGQAWGRERSTPTLSPLSFPLLLLGLNGLFVTGDVFNFYVFFELVAVSSYMIVATGKHAPLEAAWKYSAQSVFGSVMLLLGVVSLYGLTGALEMAEVGRRLAEPAYWVAPFFLIAFLLKGALVPFHFWQPDAHAAATTTGSALMAGLLINVGLYGLLRFWPILMGDALREVFLMLGVGAIAFGAIAAWRQADAKRMLGFSSISQLGYVLLAFGWGTTGALAAALLYLISHALAKVLLFLSTGSITDAVGSTRFADLAGRGKRSRIVTVGYFMGALSLIGLPPGLGFIAKIALLREGLAAGALVGIVLGALGSLMTAGYCLKAFQVLCWEPCEEKAPAVKPMSRVSVAAATGLVLVGLLGSGVLWEACLASARELRP